MKTVQWKVCPCGVKRGFENAHLADKALGRAQTKRNRAGDKAGSRRGLERENRTYECRFGSWHLTKQSKREHVDLMAMLQEQYASEIGLVAA